jgi:hypothetical protein
MIPNQMAQMPKSGRAKGLSAYSSNRALFEGPFAPAGFLRSEDKGQAGGSSI